MLKFIPRDIQLNALARLEQLLQEPVDEITHPLRGLVSEIYAKRDKFLKLSEKYQTPFYVYDGEHHIQTLMNFKNSFLKFIPEVECFYAMKLNHHPYLIRAAVKQGYGLDVASSRELKIALKFKPKKILYFSPGKRKSDIEEAVKHNQIVTINVDSIAELEKIGQITDAKAKPIHIGVRIHTPAQGGWTKYGISIDHLKNFYKASLRYKYVVFEGIHFHTSRNVNADSQVQAIKELATYLKNHFERAELKCIKYIDFGGGFELPESEGYFPAEIPQGKLLKMLLAESEFRSAIPEKYFIRRAATFEAYAEAIGSAINKYLKPLVTCQFYTEPGRALCSNSMHIITRIADIKDNKAAIADSGVNLVGWQRFEHEYFPIINMTHFSDQEIEFKIYGNLCTPWDIWGNYCYASSFEENDVLVIPNQGALTYSLAQNFINPIAKVYKL